MMSLATRTERLGLTALLVLFTLYVLLRVI
jgi:hypothetical protein